MNLNQNKLIFFSKSARSFMLFRTNFGAGIDLPRMALVFHWFQARKTGQNRYLHYQQSSSFSRHYTPGLFLSSWLFRLIRFSSIFVILSRLVVHAWAKTVNHRPLSHYLTFFAQTTSWKPVSLCRAINTVLNWEGILFHIASVFDVDTPRSQKQIRHISQVHRPQSWFQKSFRDCIWSLFSVVRQ